MVAWFKNRKIKTKLLMAFAVAIGIAVALAVIGIVTAMSMDHNYSYILEYPQRRMDAMASTTLHLARLRRAVSNMTIAGYAEGSEAIKIAKANYDSEIKEINAAIAKYNQHLAADERREASAKQQANSMVSQLTTLLNNYIKNVGDKVYEAGVANDGDTARELLEAGASIADELIDLADEIFIIASDYVDDLSAEQTVEANRSILLVVIITSAAALLLLVLGIVIADLIAKPLKQLVVLTDDVANGKLNVNLMRNTTDEVGILASNVFHVVEVVKGLVDDLDNMGRKHNEGDIDVMVDDNKYLGSYRDVAKQVNLMVSGHVSLILKFMEVMNNLVGGDFKATLEKLPGKKAIMNDAIEDLRTRIMGISGEINGMIKNVRDGKIKERIETSKYTGDWVTLMNGLNELLASYEAPIAETLEVIQEIAAGGFKKSIVGTYKGDFNDIKLSVNKMVANVSTYISEISTVLGALADNNLAQEIKRDYVGEFSNIKNAINNIIHTFNSVIGEIVSATEQVTAGARQISETSMTLAQGATEQASAVEELTATVMSVNEKTQLNADNAKRASGLSDELKSHAVDGNTQMKNMLSSMKSINEASNNIAKIITIIKDIAFQTNLLALNASIEAAHAGVHGAGFSVVADEVRSLAVKSQEAADNTTELIEMSITRVNEGTNIAIKTDEALEKIVNGVTEVFDIVSGISHASSEQALAISQINDGVGQIAQVVQNNSATSEESASAAEELNSQSEMLKNMVGVFHLKH